MKKIENFIILLFLLSGFSSCGRERLTPKYQAVTINQLKNDDVTRFSYQIDDTQIDEYAKNAGKFPLFGKLFQAIAIVLANTTISNSGHELELASVNVDLSSLSALDFNLIDYINLDSLKVSVRNAKEDDSLRFIEKLEILIKLDSPVEGLPVDANGYSKIVYFDRATASSECDGSCIKLSIANVNWKKLLESNKLIHLQPKLIINSVPQSTMKLAGSIDFSVKFNLGF
ncbi:MAG: hypothetical protein Q7U04_17745 [Bacteriovorax sp.]|nr:hypothetical protein [Bacteriovorax sp.]